MRIKINFQDCAGVILLAAENATQVALQVRYLFNFLLSRMTLLLILSVICMFGLAPPVAYQHISRSANGMMDALANQGVGCLTSFSACIL